MNYMDILDNWLMVVNAKSYTFNSIGLILNSLMYVLEYIKFLTNLMFELKQYI